MHSFRYFRRVTPLRDLILFGSHGLIGSAVMRAQAPQRSIIAVPWKEVSSLESKLDPNRQYDILFANGLTNPKLPAAELLEANLEFPRRIIQKYQPTGRFRFLTLGSIMEHFPEVCETNAYLRSKIELGRWIQEERRQDLLHVRLHTVYGRLLHSHMFLGQMADALRAGREFKMSSGDQLREYHHADDVANALGSLLVRNPGPSWPISPAVDINSGQPIRLADLATQVFDAFDKSELLRIGALPSPPSENKKKQFERSPSWLLQNSRDPIPAIIEIIRENI